MKKDFTAAFEKRLQESIEVKQQALLQNREVFSDIANAMLESLRQGGKVLLFGNGGSAADAQHIAAELVSRFLHDRKALPAIALTTDTSILTSVANDYAYDQVFARQIEALGKRGDVAVGISTSGNSPNVLKAVARAREMGLTTVGLTGRSGGALKDAVDLCLCVPSSSTPRIQEVHIAVAHVLCEVLELELCSSSP